MRFNFLILVVWVVSLFSGQLLAASDDKDEEKKIYESACKSCHTARSGEHTTPDGKHAKRKAPPMANVKKHYLKRYPQRDDFVNAVASWAASPNQEKALLKHAIERHGVMPTQELEIDTLKKAAAYIYDQDMGKTGCGGKEGKHDQNDEQDERKMKCDHRESKKARIQ